MAASSKPMPQDPHRDPGLRLAAQSGLDVMLTDAVVEDGGVGRFLKPRAAARTVAGLTRHPHRTARDANALGVELGRVAAGRSGVRPAKGDRRFGDRAWQNNWLFHRLMQAYLATLSSPVASFKTLCQSSVAPLRRMLFNHIPTSLLSA